MDNAARHKEIKDRGSGLCEPFRSAIAWIPDDVQIPYEQMSYWVAKPWDTHNGRVTLAGDAAHPMPPYRGQGLNHAINDVFNLVKALTSLAGLSTLPEAISTYSEEIVKRGAEETLLTRENTFLMLDYAKMRESPIFKRGVSKGSGNGD